jgi:CubicO group peptidase (beta-lactamase class C family)
VEVAGLADRDAQRKVTRETRFNLGSMNKMFTAVAIAQLVEEGKLGWDDPVGKHLPDYPNPEVREKVTIRQLLSHTSGLGSYWNERFAKKRGEIRTVSDYLALFSDEKPAFAPGSRFEYSNAGFIVLGAIVEKVTGRSYFEHVKKRVFEPAGMTATDWPEAPQRGARYAVGYTGAPPSLRRNEDELPNRGGPAGGGYSTVDDLVAFARALAGGKLVKRETLALMTTPASKDGPPGFGYGFGFGIVSDGRAVSFGHNGGAPGVSAELRIFPESGTVVAAFQNRDPEAMQPVVDRSVTALFGERPARAAAR